MPIPGLLGLLIMGGQVVNTLEFLFPPLQSFQRQLTYKLWPNLVPDMQSLIMMRHKNEIGEGEYTELAKQVGFADDVSSQLFRASEQYLAGIDYITLWRRKEIKPGELTENLSKLGFNSEQQELMKKVTLFYPSPQDLITWAVREVYSQETVDAFGMADDLPQEFLDAAEKAGVSVEQATNFWKAHWGLPSPQQGFRMLHFGEINDQQIDLLLKSLDVMPFWREKLKAIAYNPYTRVDVRRMAKMGLLDDNGVYKAYKEGGYNHEKAENLTAFVKQYNAEAVAEPETSITGITRSAVIRAFNDDMIDERQMTSYFRQMYDNEEVVAFWTRTAVNDKEWDEIEADTEELLHQYKIGAINKEDVVNKLSSMDLPSTYIDRIRRSIEKKPSIKIKLPSATDLKDWLQANIIDEVDYYTGMSALGYSDEHIQNYLAEISEDVDISERKYLAVSVYQRWLVNGILQDDQFRKIGAGMQISTADIERLIGEAADMREAE